MSFREIKLLIEKSWVDAYPNTNFDCSNESVRFVTRYPIISTGLSYYFKNCLFLSISSNLSGGAIYFSGGNSGKVFFEEILFFLCQTTNNQKGGAIYFEEYGDCKFLFVCGNACISNNDGQFSYLSTNSDQNNYLSLNLTSIINCTNYDSKSYTIYFLYGIHHLKTSNISNNFCYQCSGFRVGNIKISNTIHSSFENNYANYHD
jgi:hypothetical protein